MDNWLGKKPTSFKTGEEFSLFDIYYIDDGAFIFPSRRSIEIAASMINTHITRFGLEMLIGTITNGVETLSKTGCIFFQLLHTTCHWRKQPNNPQINQYFCIETKKRVGKGENRQGRQNVWQLQWDSQNFSSWRRICIFVSFWKKTQLYAIFACTAFSLYLFSDKFPKQKSVTVQTKCT